MDLLSKPRFKVLAVFVLSFLYGPLNSFAEDNNQHSMNIIPVSVVSVHYQNIAKPIIASGPVRPVSEQRLTFKVAGIIGDVWVKEGEEVKKGQVLATLILDEINASVEKAKAVLDDANRQLMRISQLKAQQLTSDQQGQQAQTAVYIAQSDLKIALFNQKYSVITAPENGRILTRSIEPHELVQSGQDAFLFADLKKGWSVKLAIADIDVVKLGLGDHANIRLDAYPNQIFKGKVQEVAGRADSHSQTFEVDVSLTFQGGTSAPKLYSGLIAHSSISPSTTQTLAAIPFSALIKANGSNGSIYVIGEDGAAILKAIKINYLDGDFVMVSNGLAEGEQVISQGGPFIVKGSQIRIVSNDKASPIRQLSQAAFE